MRCSLTIRFFARKGPVGVGDLHIVDPDQMGCRVERKDPTRIQSKHLASAQQNHPKCCGSRQAQNPPFGRKRALDSTHMHCHRPSDVMERTLIQVCLQAMGRIGEFEKRDDFLGETGVARNERDEKNGV